MGGRGASSSSSNSGRAITIKAGGGNEKSNTKKLFPAAFNTGDRFQSPQRALVRFMERHGASKKEYGVSIDSQGYAHKYHKGGKGSVAISGGYNHTVMHNHPSGNSHLSGQDLKSWSQGSEKTLIATSSKNYSSISKKNGFDGKKFWNAINGKTFKSDNAYDGWLYNNAKKYHYSYKRKN